METQHMTLLARPQGGTITVHVEIPVSGNADTYVVTIEVAPQPRAGAPTLDELYGVLSDAPMPEITADPLPEQRKHYRPVELMKLPRAERDRILAESAAAAEEEYRTNPELTEFEAFGEDDLLDEYPEQDADE